MSDWQPRQSASSIHGEDQLLAVNDLVKQYEVRVGPLRTRFLKAVDGVSLKVGRAETLGLVGESGSGKTTLGRLVMRLEDATSGTIQFDGVEIAQLRGRPLREVRARLQMVFQDPLGSLNPRMQVGEAVAEPLKLLRNAEGADLNQKVEEIFGLVGLAPHVVHAYPHELSGGQQQRVSIARALAPEPDLLILDEATSALDVSVQARLLNLLRSLQRRLGFSQVVISHDLSVVAYLADRIAVMYLGRVIETGPTPAVYRQPAHPYTAALISALPGERLVDRPTRLTLGGNRASAIDPPEGCRLAPRCPFVRARCVEEPQVLRPVGAGHYVACWRAAEGEIHADDFRAHAMAKSPTRPDRAAPAMEREINQLETSKLDQIDP